MIAVIDFGSQTAHLIARRVRDLGVAAKIFSFKTKAMALSEAEGIIISGGPGTIYLPGAPKLDKKIYSLAVPVLGICYGMQLMGDQLGGKVKKGSSQEYGGVRGNLKKSKLFEGAGGWQRGWMSHSDQVVKLPSGFVRTGESRGTKNLAMVDEKRGLYGVQFHPEVVHTQKGRKILKNFLFDICGAKKNWGKSEWLESKLAAIRKEAGVKRAICGLSGGIDSTTAAAMVFRAIGKNLTCVFVDNGLMRLGEAGQVKKDFKEFFGDNLVVVRAQREFLAALKGVTDPEKKRKIIGRLYIRLFEAEAKKVGASYLVQGTIYPDVIESARMHDAAASIKTHHNVGGLPKKMRLQLIEPLRDLYKDEVKAVAKKLGLPQSVIERQPFPGPGLAVRIRGEVTLARLARLRQAEGILKEEMEKITRPKDLWMAFCVYVPVATTGVKGDSRSFEEMIAIRSVDSTDAMTANWTRWPPGFLARVSARIVNEVPGINRVVYDITTKPPATMEWE